MRTTVLALTLLSASLIALAPSAQADGGCPGPGLRLPGVEGDIVLYPRYPACGYTVYLNEGKECADGDDDWNSIYTPNLGSVNFNTCGDPDQGLLDNAGVDLPIPMHGNCAKVPQTLLVTVDEDCRDVEQKFGCEGEPTRRFVGTAVHQFVLYHCTPL